MKRAMQRSDLRCRLAAGEDQRDTQLAKQPKRWFGSLMGIAGVVEKRSVQIGENYKPQNTKPPESTYPPSISE